MVRRLGSSCPINSASCENLPSYCLPAQIHNPTFSPHITNPYPQADAHTCKTPCHLSLHSKFYLSNLIKLSNSHTRALAHSLTHSFSRTYTHAHAYTHLHTHLHTRTRTAHPPHPTPLSFVTPAVSVRAALELLDIYLASSLTASHSLLRQNLRRVDNRG